MRHKFSCIVKKGMRGTKGNSPKWSFFNEITTLDLGLPRSIQMWKFVSLGHLFIWTLAGTGCEIAAKLQQLIGDCIWCPEDRLRQKRTRNHQQQWPILDTLQTIGEHGSWLARFIYIYILATAYRPLLVWPLKTKATGTGNESTAGQPNDDSNVSARQRQGN